MPGLHFALRKDISPGEISAVSDDLSFKSDIKVSEWERTSDSAILFSSYDGYPCSFFDSDNFLILIEGIIYNHTDAELKKSLRGIAESYLAGEDYKSGIEDFVAGSDGDFVILINFSGRKEAILFNDRWGRLPLFYTQLDGLFALSREMKFLLHWLPHIEFDFAAMAQFLVFEYNFGDSTIFKQIQRLAPASLIKMDCSNQTADIVTILPINFGLHKSGLSRSQIIERCLELFEESLKSRIQRVQQLGYEITADLSAGFDTRAVVAGLNAQGAGFDACTDNPTTGDESAVSKRVARLLGVNLICFKAEHPLDNIGELSRLTYITDGLVNCFTTLSCYYDDLEREKNISGRYANFMGFGGEFIRHPLKPKSGYAGLFEMISDDAFSSFLKIPAACSLLGLDKREFLNILNDDLSRFPETELFDKMKRLFFELHDKQVKSGEDRHRLFRWTVQPLWGSFLFDFEMHNIPLEIIDDDLFIEFIRRIDSRALKIPFQGKMVSPRSVPGRFILMFERRIIRIFRDNKYLYKLIAGYLRRRRIRSYPKRKWNAIAEESLSIIEQNRFLASFFDINRITRFIKNCKDAREFYQLLTLILYLTEIEKKFGKKIINPDNSC
jgi:hypothetical protein